MPPLIEPRRTFDISRLSAYLECERMYDFRYEQDLVLDGGRPMGADFGTAIHSGLEAWYGTGDKDAMRGAFTNKWTELGGDTPEDDTRTCAHGLWILERYVDNYKVDNWTVRATERAFAVDIPDPDTGEEYWLVGRWDMEVMWNNVITLVDHKTDKYMGYSTTMKYKPNLQTLGYIWAAQKLIGPEVTTIVMNAISTAKNKDARGKARPAAECFMRVLITYIEEELAEFPMMFIRLAHEINGTRVSNNWMPNFGSCSNYGECAYRRICTQPRSIWPGIIESGYKPQGWSPLTGAGSVISPKDKTVPAYVYDMGKLKG